MKKQTEEINDNKPMLFGAQYAKKEVAESGRGDYIELKTDDGKNYYDYLINLFEASTTHHAIVTGLSNYTYGEGLAGEGSKLISNNDLRTVCFDLKLFNKYALQIIWNQAKTEIVRIIHLPAQNVRIARDADGFYYSDNWSEHRKAQYKPKFYPAFGSPNKDLPQIYFYQPYTLNALHYSLPDYNGGIAYIDLEIEIGIFHNSAIKSGFTSSAIINFNNGIPDEATRKKIEKSVNDKWSGSSNAGRLMVTFNQSKENGAELLTAPTDDNDKRFQFLTEETAIKIMTAHRITNPQLFGIKGGDGLSSNADELANSFNLLNDTVIEGYRREIEDGLNYILRVGNVPNGKVEFVPFTPKFISGGESVEVVEDETEANQFSFSGEFPTVESMVDYMGSIAYELDEDYGPEWYVRQTEDREGVQFFDEKTIEKSIAGTNSDSRLKSRLDGPNYTVRFRYTGPLQEDSRDFCKVMQTANKGRNWRIEDISKLSLSGTNSDMNQNKKYSIFEIKGLWNCNHYWTAVQRVRNFAGSENLKVPTINEVINDDPFTKKLWNDASELNKTTDGWVSSKSGYKRKT